MIRSDLKGQAVPIDLDTTESYLFAFLDNGRRVAVSVPGRTEAEARHRFHTMTVAEKRRRVVAALSAQERDLVADFARWLADLGRRAVRRPA